MRLLNTYKIILTLEDGTELMTRVRADKLSNASMYAQDNIYFDTATGRATFLEDLDSDISSQSVRLITRYSNCVNKEAV